MMTAVSRVIVLTLLCAALGFAVPGKGWAQNMGVTDTIDRQIAAFKADDFDEAFTFASPMIRNMFGTSDRFGQMVRQGYPMVWRPADVKYGSATEDGALVRQTVVITDQSGAVHVFEYEMVQGPDGSWLINGVRRVEAPLLGA